MLFGRLKITRSSFLFFSELRKHCSLHGISPSAVTKEGSSAAAQKARSMYDSSAVNIRQTTPVFPPSPPPAPRPVSRPASRTPGKIPRGRKITYCELCPFRTDNNTRFSRHVKIHEPVGEIPAGFVECSICSAVLRPTSLFRHSMVHKSTYRGSFAKFDDDSPKKPSPAKKPKTIAPPEILDDFMDIDDELIEQDMELEMESRAIDE